MMKVKKIKQTLSLALITAILGSFMNLSTANAESLDKPVLQISKSEVAKTTTAIDIQLNDGETVKVPLIKSTNKTSNKTSNVPTESLIPEIGNTANQYGYIYFSRNGDVISYSITLYEFFTSVSGTASITDYYSGLSAGFQKLFLPSGTITCNGLSGHTYRLTLEGICYSLTNPVATFYAQAGWTKR